MNDAQQQGPSPAVGAALSSLPDDDDDDDEEENYRLSTEQKNFVESPMNHANLAHLNCITDGPGEVQLVVWRSKNAKTLFSPPSRTESRLCSVFA